MAKKKKTAKAAKKKAAKKKVAKKVTKKAAKPVKKKVSYQLSADYTSSSGDHTAIFSVPVTHQLVSYQSSPQRDRVDRGFAWTVPFPPGFLSMPFHSFHFLIHLPCHASENACQPC
jgi:hypothetical protein